jgi:DNA-binding MarR family transcriptional regulator
MGRDERRVKKNREEAIRRYLELQPIVRARLTATVPPDLHREFESITAHQLRALLLLPDEGLSMRQLAVSLGVMGATVSVLADRLVAQGLAVRLPDPSDRRVVRLAPSEHGRALAERAAAQQRRSAAEIFNRLSDVQVIAFLDVLETLAAWTPETPDASPHSQGGVRAADPVAPPRTAIPRTTAPGGAHREPVRVEGR